MAKVNRVIPVDLVTVKEASVMLGMSPYSALREGAAGRIKVVALPAFPLVFDRKSVEKRAREIGKVKPGSARRRKPATASA